MATSEKEEDVLTLYPRSIIQRPFFETVFPKAYKSKKRYPPWDILPNPVWDRLVLALPFNSRIQASNVCREWRRQIKPYLWHKPSRRWFSSIIRQERFLQGISAFQSSIRTFDCVPVCPVILLSAIKLCTNIEDLVLNCSQPYRWSDHHLLSILSLPNLAYSLKTLIIYELSSEFSSWRELSLVLSGMNGLTLLTLPAGFPYGEKSLELPSSLKFLNVAINEGSYKNFLSIDLEKFLGVSINFDFPGTINLKELLLRLNNIHTLSLEGSGIVSSLNCFDSPRFLTGLKIKVDCKRDELQFLLRKCRSLKHVELCHPCCDDRALKILVRHNLKLQVLKLSSTSITTVGISFIFRSKCKLQSLALQSQHENCGPYDMRLKTCPFLDKLSHLRIGLTIYSTIQLLKVLSSMSTLSSLEISICLHQIGNLGPNSIFTPTPPYLSFFPVMTQMEQLLKLWPTFFRVTSNHLVTLGVIFDGNATLMEPFQIQTTSCFINTLGCFPCLLHPRLSYLGKLIFPPNL
ncbi:hypothetical protein DSO57_1015330 [Entomophthora muscae]|uniref:Uncharacterized protein n=1 Tax=Entomophthora muscae TaxID=34485 RepID=A0ACC2UEI9_9FUNG|nr:hypothetical protein DSO57_1015330 [Entomophthora muscae]